MVHCIAWILKPLCTGAVPLLLCLLAWSQSVSAQVNRCEHADGKVVYTDRRCSDIGAIQRDAATNRGGSHRIYRGGCARNLQDLLFEMTTAIDSGDTNRLASLYHWPGMSSGNATRVMEHLDAVVHRPLIDLVPVTPEPPPPSMPLPIHGYAAPPQPAQAPPSVMVQPRPVAVRVVQTLDNRTTPSETVFRLHRYFGCLWIRH